MRITDLLNITHEDNMLLMSRYPDKYFDLAIVDPPYGINAPNMKMGENKGYLSTASKLKGRLNSGGGKLKNRILNKSEIDWDDEVPNEDYFKELFRVSKNQIIWGGNYFPLPPTRGIIFWDKLQPWENFSQFELAWSSFDKPAAKVTISTTGGANKEKKIHPTQKPVELYKWLLNKYAQSGDKILDTHLGSASIAIACHDYNFELTACEKKESYFKDSIQRINAHTQQLKLF
ncbi:DNA methyltransferase [Chryseobacterium salviniae]|uniref:site-specific DNA-methyltransferase (adenine-specific) n=1 Tax=Chryseobacterium salviniae TaxID=3101750 RepID=A0ABU6HU69_9FLAO|nr:DNA methyltransferase [Chryseobacterium sp. T9W2-O]MEC3875963.1 DNA methyltransferase [Chryseobacterium sp. T9W2-O]